MEPLWKLKLPLDGSKCHLFHTPEALPHGMVQPITASMFQRFQNLNKVVDQITHINPCKGEIVPQEK